MAATETTATPETKPSPLWGVLKDQPSEVKIELARLLDNATSAARLALVIHRMAEKDSPELLCAWEVFLNASKCADGLSHLMDYGPVDFD